MSQPAIDGTGAHAERRHRFDLERQSKMHSWQSERRWSCWTLFNLSLHPAHHLKASEGWWDLQPYDGAPDMFSGYYGTFWPALFSPLWKRWMAQKLAALPSS